MTRAARLVVALLLFLAIPVVLAPAASARVPSVSVVVENVSPSVPPVTATPTPVTITVRLTNNTDRAIDGIRVTAERNYNSVSTQSMLEASLDQTAAPAQSANVPATSEVLIRVLPARTSAEVAYTITTSTESDGTSSLCLCNPTIYPLYVAAEVTEDDGSARVLGGDTTYIASMAGVQQRTRVGWLWPLIDRPHRLTSDSIFLDDDLATSVADGGRLQRALEVIGGNASEGIRGVGADLPITLVIDPELLDELAIMSTGRYRVEDNGKLVAGTGQAAAKAWLTTLKRILLDDPLVEVTLTPYADPDVRSLADHDLRWASTMPVPMAARVTDALAGRAVVSDLAWPADGLVDGDTLRGLVAGGVTSLVLDQTTLTRAQRTAGPNLVHLKVDAAQADAAVTSTRVQDFTNRVVKAGASGYVYLPPLLAEIAIRSIEQDGPTFLAITPPRYVDPDVAVAVRAIRETSTGLLASGESIRNGISASRSSATQVAGRLASSLPDPSPLPAQVLNAVTTANSQLPVVQDMLDFPGADPSPATFIAGLATARQRIESAGFRAHAQQSLDGGGAGVGAQLSRRLRYDLLRTVHSVRIVPPTSGGGNYTLASGDSKLPITVRNDLGYRAQLRVTLRTVNNLAGLSAVPRTEIVEPHSQRSFPIRFTKIDRSGVIPVEVQLATPRDQRIGRPISLKLHSTVLGVVGVIITAVAGGILVLALVVRFVRQTRRRRSRPRGAPPAVPAQPREPVS